MTNKEYLRINEAAKLLDVNPESIRRWLVNGILKGTKLGRIWRIKKEDLDNLPEKIA